MNRYPNLPDKLKSALDKIEPSRARLMNYYPCLVAMRSGTIVDRVYVQEELSYLSTWGIYPDKDKGKSWIDIREVASISESPSRLPAALATKLYQSGETRMGGHEFTVEFSDGTKEFSIGGNAVDFIEYPTGKSPKDVIEVHNGGRGIPRHRPLYFWCLYSTPLARTPRQ